MTGADQHWFEAFIQPAKGISRDALTPDLYVVLRVSTATGSYAHAFTPSQTLAQGSENWPQVMQRFNLHLMIDLLEEEHLSSVTQTVCKLFTESVEVREIAASYSQFPCIIEQNFKSIPDSIQMSLFVEPNRTPQEEAIYPLPDSVTTDFDNLAAGTTPPDPDALNLAKSWAESLYREIRTQEDIWIDPHLTVQDGGDVVFEWWKGQKSLGVYVSADEVWYLESAGINSAQHEGIANSAEVRRSIWQWLTQ